MSTTHQSVRVTITLSESQDPERIVRELKQAGLVTLRLMKITGIVTGLITRSRIKQLKLIPGVKSVEESRHVQGMQ